MIMTSDFVNLVNWYKEKSSSYYQALDKLEHKSEPMNSKQLLKKNQKNIQGHKNKKQLVVILLFEHKSQNDSVYCYVLEQLYL